MIPDGVTSIAEGAFSSCNLTSIVIPKSVTSIADYAFAYCSNLTRVEIPENVSFIGYEAFSDCSILISLTCLAAVPPTLRNDAFWNMSGTIYVPAASVEAYKAAAGWKDYANRIQAIPE